MLLVRASTGVRLLRASLFALWCVVLTAASHALASGRGVRPASLVVGWIVVAAVAAPLSGRQRTRRGICLLLAAGQLALHASFDLGQTCGHAMPRMEAVAGPVPVDSASGGSFSTFSKLAGAWHAIYAMSLSMLLGHVLAAVAAGWLLGRGEAALWSLLRVAVEGAAANSPAASLRVARGALSAVAVPLRDPRRGRRWTEERPTSLAPAWLRHSILKRGPPASAGAV